MNEMIYRETQVGDNLQLFTKWCDFLKWLLDTTEKFPKKIRFTFSTRIDNLALDILENIIEYKYDRESRRRGYRKINIKFEKLRILLRLCFQLKHISSRQYEYAAIQINEVGKMTAGWLRGAKEK